MKVNELREFYGSIGRRCRIKDPRRHRRLELEGEYNIVGFQVQQLDDGRMIYRIQLRNDDECWCGYVIDYDEVELIG